MKAKLGQGEKECDKKNSQAAMHSDYECQIMDNKMLGGSLQTQDDLFFCIGTCFHKAKSLHNTRTVFNYEMTNYVLNT